MSGGADHGSHGRQSPEGRRHKTDRAPKKVHPAPLAHFEDAAPMIIETQHDVTKAGLAELARAPNARFREIMAAFVRHLHDFAREVKLTEEEFQAACAYIVAIGKHSNETHNEAVLMSGSLSFSQLVCLLNHAE